MMAILIWALYIVIGIVCVMVPVKLTNYLYKNNKIKVNRWVIAGVSPLILIVPRMLFKEISPIIWNILLLIFLFFVIMFFEITRIMIESKKLKGLVDYSTFIKKDDKKSKNLTKGVSKSKKKR
ncbi:hypothetical protein [Clostridium amazonitimonense]|uniref:hypothetical protein n=1 Tax=Clostridium amazonitimonense TaxID=1499689 RepID=UPI00068BDB26|nr:hypothetical protein [Clostridium amazonitimonense]